jgi:PilZ domain
MPQNPDQLADDVVIFDRRHDLKIIVSLAGRYILANKRDKNGDRSEIACRIVSVSSRAMTLLAPVKGAIGERVITHCDEFGKLEGSIVRVLDSGFVMSIAAKDEERTKLAVKIEWYENNKNHDLADGRNHKRIVPKNPLSTLVLADKSEMACFVIDMSISGIAVSADIMPEIGTQLAVGKLVGRVVRHFADGFAVQFIELQNLDGLEQELIQA